MTTTATSASTPKPEDRMVDGVESAGVVRDKFLAVADQQAKDFTTSKKQVIDNSIDQMSAQFTSF